METEQNEELKKQFPVLVAEVKPLMAMAKDFDIDTTECRRLIDKAVRAENRRTSPPLSNASKNAARRSVSGSRRGSLVTSSIWRSSSVWPSPWAATPPR